MTYDQWKTRDPNDRGFYDDDEYDERMEEDYCEHSDYEVDILSGRAECSRCPHSWYLTDEEISAEIDRQARHQEDVEREERREFWRRLTYPIRWFIFRVLERIWPRKSLSVLTDDEIPF